MALAEERRADLDGDALGDVTRPPLPVRRIGTRRTERPDGAPTPSSRSPRRLLQGPLEAHGPGAGKQEGRHSLPRKIFHGKAGQLYQRYHDDMEDQIGALGLVLNAVVLFNTRYMDAAVAKLRSDGFEVRDEDVARLSPFARDHINMLGRYSFQLPELPGGMRPLRDPDAPEDE